MQGDWNLVIADQFSGDVGYLLKWVIEVKCKKNNLENGKYQNNSQSVRRTLRIL